MEMTTGHWGCSMSIIVGISNTWIVETAAGIGTCGNYRYPDLMPEALHFFGAHIEFDNPNPGPSTSFSCHREETMNIERAPFEVPFTSYDSYGTRCGHSIE
jgi:hypothetical protein